MQVSCDAAGAIGILLSRNPSMGSHVPKVTMRGI